MKTSRVFWGVLFVAFGILFLLERFSSTPIHYLISWRLWPLLLVLWGVAQLVSAKAVRYGIAIFAAIFLAILVMSVIGGDWEDSRDREGAPDQTFEEAYNDSVQHASFTLESGAGVFTLRDTSSALMTARTRTNVGSYSIQRVISGEHEALTLGYKGRNRGWRFDRVRNSADVRLHPAPVWDLRFEVGASRLDVDATPFLVEAIQIDAGAADVRVRLGDRADNTTLTINAGASALRIYLPESSGCQVTVSAPLSAKDFKGFERLEKGLYRTSNYSAASKKVTVEIDAGVSSLKIVRYR